jgi:hypothetical protein
MIFRLKAEKAREYRSRPRIELGLPYSCECLRETLSDTCA